MKNKNIIKSLFIAGLVVMTAASCDPTNGKKQSDEQEGLCFTCTSGNVAIAMTKMNTSTKTAPDISLLYSKDKTIWLDLKIGDGKGGVSDSTSINLAPGDKVYFKAKTTNDSLAVNNAYNFFTTTTTDDGKVDVSGNIMTLLDGNNPGTTLSHKYSFAFLFMDCEAIKNASGLSLPATTLSASCYSSMFYDCSALTTGPMLPATTLTNFCYSCMFQGCSALTTAPTLPATTLTNQCYMYMFSRCSKLPSVTMLATDVSASMALFMWLFEAGTEAGTHTLYVDPTMTGNSTITDSKGNFTVTAYSGN